MKTGLGTEPVLRLVWLYEMGQQDEQESGELSI